MKSSDIKGFTLIELLIVVAILAILSSIAIPAYRNYITTSKQKSAESILEQFPVLLESYRAENGSFPPGGAAPGTTYTYSEAPGTDTITPILPDFKPRSATLPAGQLIPFDYSLIIIDSGTANERTTFTATGVRDGLGITASGTYD